MSSTPKNLETITSAVEKALSSYSREANFGAREHISWMIDEENRKISFIGRIQDYSLPTYYSYSTIEALARQDPDLKKALDNLLILGYEVVLWRDDEDLEGRNDELDFHLDINEYKQLLATFPPVVIHNQKEADRVSRFIDKILSNSEFYTQARDTYACLLEVLLRDWEARKASESEKAAQPGLSEKAMQSFQLEPLEDISF